MANWSIGGVTLPQNPHRLTLQYAADVRDVNIPATKSLLISMGNKSDKLTIEGILLNNALSRAAMKTTYIDPFIAKLHTDVVIDDNDLGLYDGTWIMTKFEYREEGGYTVSWRYTMDFIKGSTHVVIT